MNLVCGSGSPCNCEVRHYDSCDVDDGMMGCDWLVGKFLFIYTLLC